MQLAAMLLFAAVVREGSFTRAARSLGITKQTASERIANLEASLGVRLLERTTRRLRVTDAGARYAERCAALAAGVDEANREVRQQQAEPTGVLRVSAPVLYGRRFLAPVVAGYLRQFPKMRVEIVLADRRIDLVEDRFDLAVRVGRLDDSSLTARKLGEGHIYYVASPGFLADQGRPEPAALARTRCIGMQPVETWAISGHRVKLEPVLVVNDLEVGCDAAVAGVGVARLPSIVCHQAVRSGALEILFGPQPDMVRPVHVVYASRQHLPLKTRAFVDALAALVEPMLPIEAPPRPSRRRPGGSRGAARARSSAGR